MATEKKTEEINDKLEMWKSRYAKAKTAYSDELDKIGIRDDAYNGIVKARNKYTNNDKFNSADTHIRNIIYELIESQINSEIPQPKVVAKRKKDEGLARTIENMLRDELDRLSFEVINDQAERMCPIQGGCFYLCEWDDTKRTHTTVGENSITFVNPLQVIPQSGVTDLEEMDYVFIRVAKTKEYIKKKYGITFDAQDKEEDPEIRSSTGDEDDSDDLVTQYIAYYRADNGRIGLYSWALDKELCDMDDYQMRRMTVCANCGVPTTGDAVCPVCGSKDSQTIKSDGEDIVHPLVLSDGTTIDADYQNPIHIPYYQPDVFPIVLQKNVSQFKSFLGGSDVDRIYDQQATTNRISARVNEKLLTGGSLTSLPPEANIKTDNSVGKTIMLKNPADADMLHHMDLTCDISQELAWLSKIYEEARQTLGITDSYQGRNDSTATSKVAKEFAARQSAGRLESKRRMKNFAYSKIFEIMFKYKLAYADEPRPIRTSNAEGDQVYEEFNRLDFLEIDESGELYWNDDFLFSTDTSSEMTADRETMWREMRNNLETGAFGDPASLETLIMFWNKMEMLHYPGSSDTKNYLMTLKEKQEKKAQEQMTAQNQSIDGVITEIDERARADALATAQQTQTKHMPDLQSDPARLFEG